MTAHARGERTRRGTGADDGSVTVVLAAVVAVALVLAAFLGVVASARAGRLQAQTAADLAALAAASALRAGGDACATARLVAERNGASVSACTDEGNGVVRVGAQRRTGVGTALAEARAGPRPASAR
ncbi:histidine kinase [Cellulomonas fimi]|uniref:Rv3654c family TadE-like protein n=1 Tax=Cellulomonas fimi TaxID=1708 RepID=UPI00234D328D|nr:Rv3654c family TadE-like protein [Cellulomonas fimi]MDC7123485.1 histidine kinase [Cellulomonas fimi]